MSVSEDRAFGQLRAQDYRVGDRVMGDAGDGTYAFGVVMRTDEKEVTVRWADEQYDSNCVGNLVSPHWLRLFPARAQRARLATVR